VDRASASLSSLPGTAWCINAGGDVLVGRHRHVPPTGEDAAAWRIGVEDPRDRAQIRAVVPLTAGAVATSGAAARGAHLFDPAIGSMVGRVGSTTVVGPSLLWADVWATALFVGGPDTAAAFSRNASGSQTFAA
jgi:thiamine biosynthesis lipoprotein